MRPGLEVRDETLSGKVEGLYGVSGASDSAEKTSEEVVLDDERAIDGVVEKTDPVDIEEPVDNEEPVEND